MNLVEICGSFCSPFTRQVKILDRITLVMMSSVSGEIGNGSRFIGTEPAGQAFRLGQSTGDP